MSGNKALSARRRTNACESIYVGVDAKSPAFHGLADGIAAFAKEAGTVARRLKERGLQFI